MYPVNQSASVTTMQNSYGVTAAVNDDHKRNEFSWFEAVAAGIAQMLQFVATAFEKDHILESCPFANAPGDFSHERNNRRPSSTILTTDISTRSQPSATRGATIDSETSPFLLLIPVLSVFILTSWYYADDDSDRDSKNDRDGDGSSSNGGKSPPIGLQTILP